MHLRYKNINDAFEGIVRGFRDGDFPMNVTASRNGEVISCSEPMTITYEKPIERVLFNDGRDCNPFFHLYESLWMLAGRNDVASLDFYNSQMKNYSDDGKTFNSAYGYRWRNVELTAIVIPDNIDDLPEDGSIAIDDVVKHCKLDQLKILIDHLKADPLSRRAVLSMWNVEDDLLKIDSSKDIACNLCVKFRVGLGLCPACNGTGEVSILGKDSAFEQRYGMEPVLNCKTCKGTPRDQPRYLNMTVFNRSNDAIWGMLGANVVHFSFLQEYMAAHLGLAVGEYHQIADDLHVYTEKFAPDDWFIKDRTMYDPQPLSYERDVKQIIPLVQRPEVFDVEVEKFVNSIDGGFDEPFLRTVAQPMCWAFRRHKERHYEGAYRHLSEVRSDDWKLAGTVWIKKRQKSWEKKNAQKG